VDGWVTSVLPRNPLDLDQRCHSIALSAWSILVLVPDHDELAGRQRSMNTGQLDEAVG
jgi:hypothetical protein